MVLIILFTAIVIFSCILTNKFSSKIGLPVLVFFMFLGMLFGCDGIFKLHFDDYDLTSKLCSIGLIFIIFYGGFCTKKPENKKVTLQAILLSSFGTIFTALFCALFCFYTIKMSFAESFLIGAIISSTDAASVFSILRSKSLNLKYNTAPILEMESGSNDPFAYMLTMLGLVLLKGGEISTITPMLFKQLFYGISLGVLIALFAVYFFRKTRILVEGTDSIFLVATALAAFAVPELIGGNGYLSVYLAGIIIGNSRIKNKIRMIHFFDGITALCQVLIFFLIGFLSFPHKVPEILIPALLITIFLSFIARPLALGIIMLPFKAKFNQLYFMSWAGLRGAASIVFALLVVAQSDSLKYDLFHIVFVVSFLSVAIQGSLLPLIAKKHDMIDKFADVRKTFNDYQQEASIVLNKFIVNTSHLWCNTMVKDMNLEEGALILYIQRDGKRILPKGGTVIEAGDEVVVGTTVKELDNEIILYETYIDSNHDWLNKKIRDIDYPENFLIALVKRKNNSFVPNGDTILQLGDTIIFHEEE